MMRRWLILCKSWSFILINDIKMRDERRKQMGNSLFDYSDSDIAYSVSDNMAINSNGDYLMRMGDDMAMDMQTGELHMTSNWPEDDE